MLIFLKRSIYVFLLWITCLWTPVYSQQFDYAISLGSYCMVAIQLSKCRARDHAYPLDWTNNSFEGMLKFIAHEGYNFLIKEHLLFKIEGHEKVVYDLNYDAMRFPHDFDFKFTDSAAKKVSYGIYTQVKIANYEDVLAKYQRRIARFFDVLRSDKTVLFVRYDISYEQAILLDALLRAQYPQLNYMILALGPSDEIKQPWGLERVRNYYMPFSLEFDGITPLWQHVFSQFPMPQVLTDPAPTWFTTDV